MIEIVIAMAGIPEPTPMVMVVVEREAVVWDDNEPSQCGFFDFCDPRAET